MALIIHLHRPLRELLGIHPYTFDTNPQTIQSPLIDIGETPGSERFIIDIKVRQNRVGCREHPLIAAYRSEFAQTLPESGAGPFKTIESLGWLEWRVRGRESTAAHLVQIVDEPDYIISLEIR